MLSTHTGSGENWDEFNRLARTTLQYAPLDRSALTELFIRVEALIFSGVNSILQISTFVEDNLCYVLAEIATGVIKSRKVYKGKRVCRRVNLCDMVEMGSENKRIFGVGFDLFKLSRIDREKAVPFVRRLIRTLRMATNTYENILIVFSKETSEYCALSDQLASLTIKMNEAKLKGEDHTELMGRMGALLDEMDLIELNVGCVDPNFLYGTIKLVESIVKRIRVLQERVLKAYSRLLLKPVREKAQSEMEAFDLFQSGSLGLTRAISLYDVRSGTGFPTFANWWIRQRIFGSTKHSSRSIRLPGSVWEMHQRIKAVGRKFESDPEKNGVYTLQDIADHLNMSLSSVEKVIRKVESTKTVPLDSLSNLTEEGYDDDTPVDRALLDSSVEEEAELNEKREFITRVLQHVPLQQRNLICLRYGVVDSVKNDDLDHRQVLREILRQTVCKAILQGSMTLTAEEKLTRLRSESVPLD